MLISLTPSPAKETGRYCTMVITPMSHTETWNGRLMPTMIISRKKNKITSRYHITDIKSVYKTEPRSAFVQEITESQSLLFSLTRLFLHFFKGVTCMID